MYQLQVVKLLLLVYRSGNVVSKRELGSNTNSHPYLRTDDTGSTQTVNDPVTFTDCT